VANQVEAGCNRGLAHSWRCYGMHRRRRFPQVPLRSALPSFLTIGLRFRVDARRSEPMREMKMSQIPARLRRNLYLILPVGLYLLLRIPSLIEPHWYQDEAGYASTVWLTH